MLPRLGRCVLRGADARRDNASICAVNSVMSSGSPGGVEAGVSEPSVSSFTVSKLSPLLESVLWCDMLNIDSHALFGSQGMGLFGSLEAQFGILVCLCGVMDEKELRLMGGASSCGTAIFLEFKVVVV